MRVILSKYSKEKEPDKPRQVVKNENKKLKKALEDIKKIVQGEPFKYCSCNVELLEIINGVLGE